MRGTRLLLAMCAGLVATPVLAENYGAPVYGSPLYNNQSMITGDIALAFGWYDQDWDASNYSTGEILGSVRVNAPINEIWNAELEIAGLSEFRKHGYGAIGAFGHFYYKDPQWALGGFVGVSGNSGGYGSGDDSAVTLGLEKAYFMANATLKGHASYSWADGYDDFWAVSGAVGWYLNPNTRLDGRVTYWNGSDETWGFTGGAEHKFAGTNYSAYADATYYNWNDGHAWELIAGGRFAFGRSGSTLQQDDWDRPFEAADMILTY